MTGEEPSSSISNKGQEQSADTARAEGGASESKSKTGKKKVASPTQRAKVDAVAAGGGGAKELVAALNETKQGEEKSGVLSTADATNLLSGSFFYSQGDPLLQTLLLTAAKHFHPDAHLNPADKEAATSGAIQLVEALIEPGKAKGEVRQETRKHAVITSKSDAPAEWDDAVAIFNGRDHQAEERLADWDETQRQLLAQFVDRDLHFVKNGRDYGQAQDAFSSQVVKYLIAGRRGEPMFREVVAGMRELLESVMTGPITPENRTFVLTVMQNIHRLRMQYNLHSTQQDTGYKHDPLILPEAWERSMQEAGVIDKAGESSQDSTQINPTNT